MNQYEEEAERQRFLLEVARLKANKAFVLDKDFCLSIHKPANYLSNLQGSRKDNYHVDTKALYYAHLIYKMDIMYVITGVRTVNIKEEIPDLKSLSKSGHFGDKTWKEGQKPRK